MIKKKKHSCILLLAFCISNFCYAQSESQCEGIVYLSFQIERGNILSDFFLQFGIDDDCDSLAIDLIQKRFQEKPRLRTRSSQKVISRLGVKFTPGQNPEIIEHELPQATVPEFPGGEDAKMRFLNGNIRYPGRAVERGVQGTVIVAFVVEKDGSITDVKVDRSVSKELDEEAVRVVKLMPKWIPGTIDGKPARTQNKVPIRWTIQRW